MKKILLTITGFFVTLLSIAQSPNLLNYQGVARNAVGNVLPSQPVGLKLSILSGSPTGPAVYTETRNVTTNAFGLFNVQVGSPGAITTVGTIAGINWTAFGVGSGTKYLQVEIDPIGGTNYFNVGSTQLVSVPYALNAGAAAPVGPAGGDLTGTYPNPLLKLPYIRAQADAGPLFQITNTGAGIGIEGINSGTGRGGSFVVNNPASTADALTATTVSTINGVAANHDINGVSGVTVVAKIGTWGESNNGLGVFGTSSTGTGIIGASGLGTGSGVAALTFGTGPAVTATSLGGQAANFSLLTPNNSNVVNVTSSGNGNLVDSRTTGTGNAVVASTSGLGRATSIQNLNAANIQIAAVLNNFNTSSTGFANGSLTAVRGPSISANTFLYTGVPTSTTGISSTGIGIQGTSENFFGVSGLTYGNAAPGNSFGVLGTAITATGTAVGAQNLSTGYAFQSVGRLQLQGISEGLNKILASDAVGNATWQTAASIGILSGSGTINFIPKLTPIGTSIGNSQLFDDGTNIGLNTVAPTHKFTVSHGGSTGISVSSTAGFSVVDINAASGDAALRFGNAGVNQWNMRNRPGDNYLEIFELGGGGSRMVIQDATGNVGIGQTVSPAYKLDVLHGGATGLRVQSSASFSVVDIDAQSGDAALRFVKAGVNQWNIRNRPSDDYLEIFELGGGGSRMVIQDATGNVGIGQTVSPAYKLDVLHGGATGLRVQSSASFSVVDIDAQSGDAALRFVKAGVNQWNIRNRPSDDYLEIFELGGGGSRMVIQDATGNVGIGQTVAPAYKLDVLHGGATGLRVQSSASFSVVDIDAQSGDAALRFVKAGVNQWNIRNRPSDDYLEIFELGGGGSRMVIQDATGNVGIGQTVAPAYKLDVLHGGATGLRVQSSASFSVVDIDGQSGDAALRFVKAGVNQWNTRNNPATDDYQIFELGGGGERMRIENTTGNVVIAQDLNVVGTLTKGAGAFKIDHPLDPENKYLVHSFVESPDMMNIYNGNIVTDASGKATVKLPDYFEALNMEFRYQLTVVGGTFAQAIISKEVSANKFEIATSQPNVKVSWQVTGIRHDAYAQKNRIPNTVEKEAKNKGKYLSPESFNQPKSKAIGYAVIEEVSSLKDVKITPVKVAKTEPATGTSIEDKAPANAANKVADNSGSVADVVPSKAVVKPVDNSGSVVDVVPTKAVVKPVDNSGSIAPEIKNEQTKQEVKPVENLKSEVTIPAQTAPVVVKPLVNLQLTPATNTELVKPAGTTTTNNATQLPEIKLDASKTAPVGSQQKEKPKGKD